ncbi:MAG: hypothetical protein ABJB65_07950 [Chloroflexota bacterium]
MTDRDPFRLEPSEGQRTSGAAGERLVVGLAAFALVAGLLIALAKLLPQTPGVTGAASPTPSPNPTASSTESAVIWPPPRLLREVTLAPGSPPPAPSADSSYSLWVRATTDVTIRAQPEPGAIKLGVLGAGSVAFAEETSGQPPDPGWLHIIAPSQGWVASTGGGAEQIERVEAPPAPAGGDIWTVAAGGDGFLALGFGAALSNEGPRPLVAASTDGGTWHKAGLAPSQYDGVVASWGPAGWLALLSVGRAATPGTAVWQSRDGLKWTALGKMPTDAPINPTQITGNDKGYLLAASGSGEPDTTFWFSEEGITWRETAASGMSSRGWPRFAAGPGGFYAWDTGGERGSEPVAIFSADARTWAAVSDGPRGPSSQVVSVGAVWNGTDVDSGTGARRLWTGEVKNKQLTWRREPDTHALDDAVVTTMVSDGRRAVAIGWERSTERPMTWIRARGGWVPSPLPGAFGGLPRVAAAGPSGVVVVGYRPTLRGQNPVFWHLAADGSWAAEKRPLLTAAPSPAPGECGSPPANAVDFMVLDHALAVACLGSTPITFRAWSPRCDGCFGASDAGRPAWLATPGANQIAVTALEGFDGWSSSVVLAPGVNPDPAWTGKWLELTGHFDDHASASCRLTPSPEEELYYAGRQSVVDGCRQQFVVTSVVAVEGP